MRIDLKVPFEQKVSYPTPHRHEFPKHFGPEHDMKGFPGLGSADVPELPHGRKHDERTFIDKHFYAANCQVNDKGKLTLGTVIPGPSEKPPRFPKRAKPAEDSPAK